MLKEAVSRKPEVIEIAPPPISKELKKRWSYFIRQVYETDPLTCPKYQGEIHISSFIDQPEIKKTFNTWVSRNNPRPRLHEILR